jgi:hypothetical protein
MAVRDLQAMLAGLLPRLDPETYVFCTAVEPDDAVAAMAEARGTFHEAEGLSLVLREPDARRRGFIATPAMRCITLGVHSALDGVGLTAAVAGTLAREGISCNVVAAYHHDHIFVPAERAAEALQCLEDLTGCRNSTDADG